MRLGGLLILLLGGCAIPVGALWPKGPASCVAYGVTASKASPSGNWSYSAGCVEQRPYPGMPRPGHDS